MTQVARGIAGRTDIASSVLQRSASIGDASQHSGVVSVSGSAITMAEFYATGSKKGSSGFIVASAGSTVITPTTGDDITASHLTAKALYEIGVQRVSGSGHVYVLF
tara:strand:+ start:36 stop:353 length:318 start_codon:yes stop_codon:yes gene_type:complete